MTNKVNRGRQKLCTVCTFCVPVYCFIIVIMSSDFNIGILTVSLLWIQSPLDDEIAVLCCHDNVVIKVISVAVLNNKYFVT